LETNVGIGGTRRPTDHSRMDGSRTARSVNGC
jgi:hypothetical protein